MVSVEWQPTAPVFHNYQYIETKNFFLSSQIEVYGANMGPIWALSAPDGPHVGPMNFAIRDGLYWAGSTVQANEKLCVLENKSNKFSIIACRFWPERSIELW